MNAADSLRASRARALSWTAVLAALLILAAACAVCFGSVRIPLPQLYDVLLHPQAPSPEATIVWTVRAPRVLLAITAGAGLSVAGVALQAMVHNVLADPYVLGVNSGASVGAALAILFGLGAGAFALQGSAFLGAVAATGLVILFAGLRATAPRLLLAGVAVGYALSAATSFLVFASDSAEGSRSVMFWLLGSLGLAAWDRVLLGTSLAVAIGIGILWPLSRHLDALAIGDDTAHSLGFHPTRLRTVLLIVTSVLVGGIVAAAGSIGFVGLVVPHLARRLVGARHAYVIPVAALLGAVLLIAADLVARTVLAPQEVPVGVITALVGTPLLAFLIRRA